MTKSAVVIGAGPGGLASAMLLARAGLKVKLLERQSRVGGRTSWIESGGFKFDVGPTFFLYPRVIREIFSQCGYDFDKLVPMVRLDPQYRLIFGAKGKIDATPDIKKMQAQIAQFSPADAQNFTRFMSENREKLERFRPVLESPFNGLRDLFTPGMLKLLPLVRPWNSLDDELKRYFSHPDIRLAFSFQSKYLGMSPFKCPGLFSILSFLEYEHGVHHPIGGCAKVTSVMADIARDMGVEIITDSPVDQILFEGRKAVGVQTAQGVMKTDAVIVNGDFAKVIPKLIPNQLRKTWSDKAINKKRYSCSTFMLYLGVEGLEAQLPHHTIYMSDSYRQNIDDIDRLHVLSEDPSLYVQNACVTDPDLAPKGMSTLYVLAPVTHQHENVNWSEQAASFREKVLDQLPKFGIKDIRGRIRFEKLVTPANWEQEYELHRGSTFSLAHNLQQMLHMRPGNRFKDVDGVYLTGGGTHPGSGLPVIFESARVSTGLLLEDLGVRVPSAPVQTSTGLRTTQPVMMEAR